MSRSTQHKISGYKPPRVQITYDLEVNGNPKEQDLPFVIGVMANFSGHLHQKTKKLKNEKFLSVNKENFNSVVQSISPKLKIKVLDKVKNDGGSKQVELNFKSIEDFNPGKIAEKVDSLRTLLETRRKLIELQTSVDCNDKLEETLIQFLKAPEALKQITSTQTSEANASEVSDDAEAKA
ncbi:type VI secretion system contractile sheath small subunit [Fluviispira multicolorata]|uniref:Type VI secretion system contractile sheath small subunit n=1 Tax=Fluviispira multicolorata TaxID=2654512 RepID=A0A833JDQ4_9BACT|nr:type VI secretion system contractile sheath small subunit [Fluviispira multicolorata]KAB8031904.1 type VI secretion system contractile sheath small subunit [Fluviispira multicolorata]